MIQSSKRFPCWLKSALVAPSNTTLPLPAGQLFSARRLRRDNVNLLAGRVVTRRMLPLTAAELGGEPATDDLLRFGGLPLVRSERGHAARIDLLEAYVARLRSGSK